MVVDRIYMDSNCFIESVKSKIGTADPARADDLWHIQQLLTASARGEVEVITSHLTIAECKHAGGPPTDEVKRLFGSILSSGKVVKLAQLTKVIAERARDLQWDHNINLGGADAVHVATALSTGCKEFLSFDYAKPKSPVKFAPQLLTLGLIAVIPANTTLVPPSYRQHRIPGS